MSVLTTETAVVVGLGTDASTVAGTTVFWAPLPTPLTVTALTTLTSTYYSVQGLGSDASTVQTSFDTITITNTAEYASLTATSEAASPTTASNNDSTSASSGLSLGAKVGIGVAIPIVVIIAALAAVYYLRRRRRSRRVQEVDTSFPQEGKPELYAGPVDTAIAGPVRKKPELPTSNVARLPPELQDTTIAEADPNAWKPRNRATKRKPLTATKSISSQGGSDKPLMPIDTYDDPTLHTTTTQSTEAELIEEADAAVQELGLLAMRKKTLVTQANALGRRPEEIEGRKGGEYRELVLREEKVRKRLDDIEAERKG